jgi:hypothetical protein
MQLNTAKAGRAEIAAEIKSGANSAGGVQAMQGQRIPWPYTKAAYKPVSSPVMSDE